MAEVELVVELHRAAESDVAWAGAAALREEARQREDESRRRDAIFPDQVREQSIVLRPDERRISKPV